MTTLFIILAIHSTLFVMLYSGLTYRLKKTRDILIQVEAVAGDIFAALQKDANEFYDFFRMNVIMNLPDDILTALTSEHRRWWLKEAMRSPDVLRGWSITCTDLDSTVQETSTFDVIDGELIIDGIPALEFFKTLPPIDHSLACSAAFRKWNRPYLEALSTQFFKINNNA